MKNLVTFITIFLLCNNTFSQEIKYEKEVIGVKDTWHYIILPDSVLNKCKSNFSDIRIYAISEDSVQIPFFVEEQRKSLNTTISHFSVINKSKKGSRYFYTLKQEEGEQINEIELFFGNTNYNWLLRLEASNNQTEWFNIYDNYRITSINNSLTNYSFNRIRFSNSYYKYYRISFKSNQKPLFNKAVVQKVDTIKGYYREYSSNINSVVKNKENESIIDFNIDQKVPISNIDIKISSDLDYQREFKLEYLADSFKTEKGWKYKYLSLQNSYLSSLEKNNFNFSEIKADKFRIIIFNHDNQAINITSINLKGANYKLTARFNIDAPKYVLSFGDKQLKKPIYDIVNFKSNIPKNITKLNLGFTKTISNKHKENVSPIFENEKWLWAILIVIIAILGWFTFSMLKKS